MSTIIKSNNVVGFHSNNDNVARFGIKLPGNSYMLIRTSAPVIITTQSGEPILVGYQSGASLSSGNYQIVSNANDIITIAGINNVYDLNITHSGYDGCIYGVENLNLNSPRDIVISQCKYKGSVEIFAKPTLKKISIVGGYGRISVFSDCLALTNLDISYSNFTGDIVDLPSGITVLTCYYSSLYGQLSQVPSKNILKNLSISKTGIYDNLSNLTSGFNVLESLNANESNLKGDVASCNSIPSLKVLALGNDKDNTFVYGNIEQLGSLVVLERLDVKNTVCSGEIQTLKSLLISSGRQSGSLVIVGNGIITNNGTIVASGSTVTITFE